MNFIGGTESFRYFKIISVNNKKVKDEGRYKTKRSPGDAAKKAFTQLSKKYKKNKLIFSIKETTQGSNKKIRGPYLGQKVKLKKPLEVKYKGKNKPVIIKYETKIHLVKSHKQKGGQVSSKELSDFNKELESIHKSIHGIPGIILEKGIKGYLGNSGILGRHKFISEKFNKMGLNDTKRQIVAKEVSSKELQNILKAERDKADKILNENNSNENNNNSSNLSNKKFTNDGSDLQKMFKNNNNNNNSSNLSNKKFTKDGSDLQKMFKNNNKNISPRKSNVGQGIVENVKNIRSKNLKKFLPRNTVSMHNEDKKPLLIKNKPAPAPAQAPAQAPTPAPGPPEGGGEQEGKVEGKNDNNNLNSKIKIIILAHGSVGNQLISPTKPFSLVTSAEVGYVYGWQKDRARVFFEKIRNTELFKKQNVNNKQYFKLNEEGMKFQKYLRESYLRLETARGINNSPSVYQRNPIRILKIHSSNEEGILNHNFYFYNPTETKSGQGVYILEDGVWKRYKVINTSSTSTPNIQLEYFTQINKINDIYDERTKFFSDIHCKLSDLLIPLKSLFPNKEPEIFVESCRVFKQGLINVDKINILDKTDRYYQQIATYFSENFAESPMKPLRSLKKYKILSTKWNNLDSRNKEILENIPNTDSSNIKRIWDNILTENNINIANLDSKTMTLTPQIIGTIFKKNPYIKIFFYNNINNKLLKPSVILQKLKDSPDKSSRLRYLDTIKIKLIGISNKDRMKLVKFLLRNDVKLVILKSYELIYKN